MNFKLELVPSLSPTSTVRRPSTLIGRASASSKTFKSTRATGSSS